MAFLFILPQHLSFLAGKETGNSKFQDAQDKGTPLIDEDGLLSLVEATLQFVKQEEDAHAKSAASLTQQQPVAAAAMYGASQPSTSAGAPIRGHADSTLPATGKHPPAAPPLRLCCFWPDFYN
jgi:hypothetical protein